MALFVKITIKPGCTAAEGCTKCVDACPMSIFERAENSIAISDENVDECTFCDVCRDRCPAKVIEIAKQY